jgi:hypothetical protein
MVQAMLRVLALLVKHSELLDHTLESALAESASAPWGEISPQLFAQLGHPAEGARRTAAELLRALARASPATVVYPLLVEHVSAEEAGDHSESALLAEVVATLEQRQSHLVRDVRLLIAELGRVTVLWEELNVH